MSRPYGQSALDSEVKKGRDNRTNVQKRTFTKWVNSHLVKKGHRIEDLFLDLRDGIYLLELLELISRDSIPKPERGKLASSNIGKTANVGKALTYLKTKVTLENIGPNDIVEGNPVLTMGLLWTVILRFEIQDISVDELSAKDALLLWVKKKTKGYPGVNVNDFSKSFRDGLAFNALIHAHRPELINYDGLKEDQWHANLANAFNVAENRLGIFSLLDPADVAVEKPDERSVMTYVAALYHYFTSQESDDVAGQRIANILKELAEIEKLQEDYEMKVNDLLRWIQAKINALDSREFPNVIKDVQALQTDLKSYIATEKAPKLKEKSDQEGQFFNIQSRLRAMNRPKYKPKEGLALHDINKAWSVLEAAEHDREAALVQEIARLRKLEELAKRFNKKADILNQWLEETERLIEQDKASETGSEAALKKLEAIMADVSAHEDRIGKTLLAGNQLQSGNYHGKESTTAKAKALEDRWKALNHSILLKKESLMSAFKLQRFYDDTRKVLEVIVTTKNSAGSQDYGSDPEHVEDLLQKHAFLESDAANIRERISNLEKERTRLSEDSTAKDLDAKIREINEALGDLDKVMGERKAKLLDAKNTHAALLALEDEDLWIKEREHDATSTSMGKDPISAQKMLKEHEALVSALETHEPVVSSVLESSKKLSAGNPQGGEELKQKIASVEEGWKNLKDASKDRHNKLKDSLDAHQYFSQADENEQFIREKEPLLATTDLGKDEESVAALLKKHQQLQDELQAHDFNIKALRSNAKGLLDKKNTESPRIEERQKEIDAMWDALRQKANQRAKDLKDAEKLYFFNKGADALNRWLDEKESFIKEADLADNLDNLGAMQKRLDELERDLAQNQSKHKELDAIARKLAEEGHPDAAKAREAADLLGSRLSVLEDQIRGRKGEVESAEQATDLLSALGDLNELLKQKEKAAASDDYGKDLASVAALKKKQDALNRDLDSLAQKVASFEPQIEKLKSESSPVAPVVEGKHRELEETLDRVRGLAQERDKKLDESLQLLRFDKDATETLAWLAEKQKEVEQLEEPKDARSAEALLKKHEKLEKAAEVYQGPRTVEQEGLKIIEEEHPSAEEVRQKLNEVREAKARLEESLAAKGKELKDAYELERFKGEANRAKIWLANKHHEASSEEVPKDQAEAEAMLQALGDIKAEAEAFSETMHRVAESGNRLVEGGHPEKEAVVQTLQGLATERAALTRAIEDRQKRLEEAASLMGFEREAQEVEDWLDAADAVLASHEAPQTMEAIEAQREAYQALQADAKIEAGKVKGVDQTASRLIEEDHEAKEAIDRRRGDIMQRWNALGAELAQRQSNLEHEAKLLQYLRDAEELEAWMRGKEEELSSEPQSGGKDLARRQEAFELDIAARGKKLEDLRRDLSDLEAQEGFDASKAALKQKELDAMFASLTEGSDRTAKQLKDASSLRQADRDLDDVELWLKGVESALASEDPGADLAASQALLKKHHLLEAEIASQDGPIRTAVQGAQHLIDEGHPASEELRDRREAVLARYAAVKDRAKARREQLEGSQSLQKYLRGVDEEKEYVRYKTAVVSSPELGRDSNSTQKLQAKHGALLQELENHEEATYRPLVAAGRELVGSGAVAADHVEPVLAALEDDWKNLRELAATRSRALADHAEHLAFRASQEDELRWLEQQINALEHAEPAGDSLSYCKALLKKNDDFMTELEAHRARIHNCHTEGDRLVQAGSTHGEEIKATQQEIEAKMQTLEDLARARKAYLEGSLRSQQLAKDASDIEAFVKENQAILDAAGAPSDLAAAQRQLEQLERLESRADGMAGMVRSLGTSRSELETAPGRQAQDAAVLERCGAVQQDWESFSSALAKRKGDVEERARAFRAADEKCLAFAERAATLNSWLDNAAEDLSEPVTVYSVEAAKKLQEDDAQFHASLDKPKRDFGELQALDGEVKGLGTEKNPYTPFTMELLSDKWEQDQAAAVDRTQLVGGEVERQARNDQLRRRFAELANALAQWLEVTRGNLLEGSGEALEDQLLAVQKRMEEIKAKHAELKPLEQLSSQLEEAMVFDNKYTEHNTIGLSQKLDALKQLATSIEHNIQQKIEAKNYTGVSEETKKEWSETFDYFDKDHKGLLDRVQFKSCLRGCGFDLPVVPEGKKDEEFEQIMKFVDSEGNGTVSKQEFIDFMFSQKKTTASSASEVIASFLTIAHDRPTVTEEELRASLPANQVEYCLKHMKTVEGGYDYKEFVNRFFSPEGIRTTHAKEELPSELKAVDTWASGRNQKMESHQSKRSDQQTKAQEKIEREKLKIAEAKAKREAARAALAKA